MTSAAILLTLAAQAAGSTLAFTHVTIIDGTDPSPRADQTIVIQGSRIVAVGPAASTPVPAGARVVEAHGKFLVPGFWDMHVHTVVPGGRAVLGLYIANGVLGVRDMAGDWTQISEWRREIAAGSLSGPRIVASGPYIEGGDVPIVHILARNAAEAELAVDSLARLGVDFIKLHSQLNREVYFATLRAARAKGLAVAGHVPRIITLQEASDSGMASVEHLLQFAIPCTPAESLALQPRFPIQRVLGPCSSADQTPVYATIARNGTRVVPTLVAQYEIAHWPKRDLPGDAYGHYLPDTLQQFVAEIFPMPDSIPPNADSVGHALLDKRVALVGTLHRHGIVVLPGTDAPLRNSPPGFGLHQELAQLTRAGLSPFEVLRAATLEPVRFLGLLDSLGTIAPGKLADFVLLDANPLADVANLRRISAVVANGHLIDAPIREALLRRAAGR